MKRFTEYCLKLLTVYVIATVVCARSGVDGLNITKDSIYKKFLKFRTLPFEDCGSEYDIMYLDINSCSGLPCQMPRGSVVIVNVLFDDNGANTSFLKHSVRWVFNSVRTDASITPDPCDDDHECLTEGMEGKSYWASVYVDGNLPVISGTMMWEAVDDKNSKVICFKVPVYITVPTNTL